MNHGLLLKVGLVFLAASCSTLAAERSWTGAVNNDWYDPPNWAPPGVPDPADTLNITYGSPNISPPFTLTSQINWTGGAISGRLNIGSGSTLDWRGGVLSSAGSLTVAEGAVVNVTGPATKTINGVLTNRGTIHWLDGTIYFYYLANDPSSQGEIWNQPGGVIDIQCDQVLASYVPYIATLHNAGLLRKSSTTGTTTIIVALDNSGTNQAQTGTLAIGGGGELAKGSFEAAAGASIQFTDGPFTASGLVDWQGPGEVCLTGGTLELRDTAGTLAMCGGSVVGSSRLLGTLDWRGGGLSFAGSLTVAEGAVVNVTGPATKTITGVLTNRGTIHWLDGTIYFYYLANDPSSQGEIWNQPGGVIDIQCDQVLASYVPYIATLHNAGLLRKSSTTGTTTIIAALDNSGTNQAQTGTLGFGGGGELAKGSFEAAAGAAIHFADGPFTASGLVDWQGPGEVCLTGGTLELRDTAGTLAMCGGSIVGSSRLLGTLDWRGGVLSSAGSLTVAAGAVVNVTGPATKTIDGVLTNRGTIHWLDGTIYFYYLANDPSSQGEIWNQPGGVIDIQCDQVLASYVPYIATLHNAGLLRKSSTTGTTTIIAALDNSGTNQAQTGTLGFGGGGELAKGSFEAAAGAAIHFADGPFTASGLVDWHGPGEVCLTGGTLELRDTAGTLTFCGGSIVGSSRLLGRLDWRGGVLSSAGSLTVAEGAVVNVTGPATKTIDGVLTNRGTIHWLDGTIYFYYLANDPSSQGEIWNQPGGVIDIQCDQVLSSYVPYIATLHNAGLLRKSSTIGTTTFIAALDNSGTVEALMGTVYLPADASSAGSGTFAFSLGGTAAGDGYGHLRFDRPLSIGGTLSVGTRNGFLPNPGNTFQVLSYPSATNDFACFSGLDLGGGLLLIPQYTRTSLTLVTTTYANNAIQPQLFISRSPVGVRITWPLGFPGWVLQSTTNPVSPVWAPVPVPCASQAFLPVALPEQYFRLSDGN